MKVPTISVILPVYNCEKYIKEAIDSILNQTYLDFELIIVNDGSTDNSLGIIHSFNDARIIVIDQKNRGLSYSLNKGIELSKGKYIARMDADDISMKDRFKKQYDFMEKNNDIDVLGGAVNYINKDGSYLGRSFPIVNEVTINHYIRYIGNVVAHPTVLMRKSKIDTVGGYCSILFANEDYHLWNKLLRKGCRIVNLSHVFIDYRILNSSISSNNFFNRRNSKIFNDILMDDNPSMDLIDELKKHNDVLPKLFRNISYNNFENKMFQNLLIVFNDDQSGKLVTFFKNIFLKIY